MRVGTCRHNRRGVALVFALFTIGLLITMSATVVGLAIRHGRTGLSSSNAEAALHAANWGVEAALNYMGMSVNTNGAMHWAVSERVEGYAVGYRLTSTTPGERRETLGGLALAQVKIPSTSKSEEAALIPSDRSANECRLLRFKSPDNVTQPYDVWIDDLTRAQVEVMVSEYLVAGQPSHYGSSAPRTSSWPRAWWKPGSVSRPRWTSCTSSRTPGPGMPTGPTLPTSIPGTSCGSPRAISRMAACASTEAAGFPGPPGPCSSGRGMAACGIPPPGVSPGT
jgi:hypothetical protein